MSRPSYRPVIIQPAGPEASSATTSYQTQGTWSNSPSPRSSTSSLGYNGEYRVLDAEKHTVTARSYPPKHGSNYGVTVWQGGQTVINSAAPTPDSKSNARAYNKSRPRK